MKNDFGIYSLARVIAGKSKEMLPLDGTPPIAHQIGMMLVMVAIPYVTKYSDQWASKDPNMYKILWVAAFVANIVSVALPGRFDAKAAKGEGFPWSSMFEPAPWAFAIWPVIYLCETLMTAYVALGNEPVKEFAKVTPFWLAGNLFQSAWCLSFRPHMTGFLWLPMAFLALSGACMGLGHMSLTNSITGLSSAFNADTLNVLRLARVPFALHTAWLVAASLLNLNAWVAVSSVSPRVQVAMAFLSAFAAGGLGAALALRTRDPLLALTAAWALTALGVRTQRKVDAAVAMGRAQGEPVGGEVAAQRVLAQTEKVLACILAALGVGVTLPNPLF